MSTLVCLGLGYCARHYVAEGALDATEALAGSLEHTGSSGFWTRAAYVTVVAGA